MQGGGTEQAGDAGAASAGAAAGGASAAESEGEVTLAALLRSASLFRGLDDAHLDRVASIGLEERHARGAKVFSHGDDGDRFYLILEGQVRISRTVPGMGEEALAILNAGEAFGEMALIDGAPRSADAIAHESCRLFVLRKDDLEDLLFVDRELAYEMLWNFVRTLSARLRETNEKMTFLSASSKFG